jgi:hypothetical protein
MKCTTSLKLNKLVITEVYNWRVSSVVFSAILLFGAMFATYYYTPYNIFLKLVKV